MKKIQELFFNKKDVSKIPPDDDDGMDDSTDDYTLLNAETNHHSYSAYYQENNLDAYCKFYIRLPEKSTDLSECDKFYELFFNKTQLNNNSNNQKSIDIDGVKYTSYLERDNYSTYCNFEMKYIKKFESKYF